MTLTLVTSDQRRMPVAARAPDHLLNGWTAEEPIAAPVYDRTDPQSGRHLVNFHLRELGLGEIWFSRDTDRGYPVVSLVKPAGLGVCRAHVLTEAAWPEGADLCVIVTWSPDDAYAMRQHHRKRTLPAGAENHWRERIAATAEALRSLGYVVEPSRFRSPYHHPDAELLVYRMPPGVAPRRLPVDAEWALTEPVPPHYGQPIWPYPEQPPADLVRAALREAGLATLFGAHKELPTGRVIVRSITQTVWPPEADSCAWVAWQPATRFERDRDTGALPEGAKEHWRTSLARIEQAMQEAGFKCRTSARLCDPSKDESVDFLVYRPRPLP